MSRSSAEERRRREALERSALEDLQLAKLNDMLGAILPANRYYDRKLAGHSLPLRSLEQLATLPLTTKDELAPGSGDLPDPVNLTWPLDRYTRFHQTSGTRGRPQPVFDTDDDWQWWVKCWQYVLDSAEVTAGDRALLAFSFGPFIGFWSAHDALAARGVMTIPGGGMSSLARLDLIERTGATVLCCTPTYALHLLEVAQQHNRSLADTTIRKIIVAGEPGGSVPAVRERIEQAWSARVTDHSGASEVGPWGYADRQRRGLHVLESHFIAEFLAVDADEPAQPGQLAQLVLTSLGRWGLPVIRYCTGDLVRPAWSESGPNRFVLLEGGVLGRVDDMFTARGVNIYPTAVEQILRSFSEVVEYRLTARRRGEMDELTVEVEDRLEQPARIAEELQLRLGLKVEVRVVPAMTLPRFEGKGKRFIDERRR